MAEVETMTAVKEYPESVGVVKVAYTVGRFPFTNFSGGTSASAMNLATSFPLAMASREGPLPGARSINLTTRERVIRKYTKTKNSTRKT